MVKSEICFFWWLLFMFLILSKVHNSGELQLYDFSVQDFHIYLSLFISVYLSIYIHIYMCLCVCVRCYVKVLWIWSNWPFVYLSSCVAFPMFHQTFHTSFKITPKGSKELHSFLFPGIHFMPYAPPKFQTFIYIYLI